MKEKKDAYMDEKGNVKYSKNINKINVELIFRYLVFFTFMSIYLIPSMFMPRKKIFKYFFPLFIKYYLYAMKVKVVDLTENRKNTGAVFYAGNHKCFMDPFILSILLNEPFTFTMKKEMVKNIFFRLISMKVGLITIDKDLLNHESHKKSYEKMKKMYNDGFSVIIFPEGKYHFDKPVGRLKRGVAIISGELKAPIIPFAIYGINNSFVFGKKLNWKTAYIKRGNPIYPNDYNDDRKFIKVLEEKITNLYLEIKSELEN